MQMSDHDGRSFTFLIIQYPLEKILCSFRIYISHQPERYPARHNQLR